MAIPPNLFSYCREKRKFAILLVAIVLISATVMLLSPHLFSASPQPSLQTLVSSSPSLSLDDGVPEETQQNFDYNIFNCTEFSPENFTTSGLFPLIFAFNEPAKRCLYTSEYSINNTYLQDYWLSISRLYETVSEWKKQQGHDAMCVGSCSLESTSVNGHLAVLVKEWHNKNYTDPWECFLYIEPGIELELWQDFTPLQCNALKKFAMRLIN